MKKFGLLVGLFCFAFLAGSVSCQSPSSPAGSAASSAVNQAKSISNNGGSDKGAGTANGFIQLSIKDTPADDAQNIWVTIGGIRVHEACDDEEDCFTPLPLPEDPWSIDLLSLKTVPLTLPTASLPSGTYNQIRMDVIEARIVFPSGPPEGIPLTVPSEEIKCHLHFDLEAGETIQVLLDFDAKNSIHVVKKGKKDLYQLRPVVNVIQVVEEGIS
jgi:Domain of unknown function (DUF4382)